MRDKIIDHPKCVEDIVAIVADPMLYIHSVNTDYEYVTIKLSMQLGLHCKEPVTMDGICNVRPVLESLYHRCR